MHHCYLTSCGTIIELWGDNSMAIGFVMMPHGYQRDATWLWYDGSWLLWNTERFSSGVPCGFVTKPKSDVWMAAGFTTMPRGINMIPCRLSLNTKWFSPGTTWFRHETQEWHYDTRRLFCDGTWACGQDHMVLTQKQVCICSRERWCDVLALAVGSTIELYGIL